jgi:hypothetical protein
MKFRLGGDDEAIREIDRNLILEEHAIAENVTGPQQALDPGFDDPTDGIIETQKLRAVDRDLDELLERQNRLVACLGGGQSC